MKWIAAILLFSGLAHAQLVPFVNPFALNVSAGVNNNLLDSLLGFLDFNEASGDALWTQMPSGCVGGCANDEVVTSTGAATSIASGSGVHSGSRNPNGTQGFYDNASQPYSQIGSDSYTFSGWVKLGSLTGNQTLFACWNPASTLQQEWRVLFVDSGTDVFRFDVCISEVTTSVSVSPSSPIATGTWYFVCAWIDAGGDTMNITAEADGVGSLPSPGSTAITSPVDTRSYGNTLGFSGNPANDSAILSNGSALDMFGFWRTNLTSAQRTALYNKTPYTSFD